MASAAEILRRTGSVCPVCLKKIPAELIRIPEKKGIWLSKRCEKHGEFITPVWKDRLDFDEWVRWETPLRPGETEACTGDCRSCRENGEAHGQGTCCVILEVTKRCNLRCTYCFAKGGEEETFPDFNELCTAIDDIAAKGNHPLIQLSGGEPTLRDDLPELVAYAVKAGCQYTQINTNGVRLAEEEAYVKRLAEAGLDIVFLQFDGTDDEIYRKLRGRDLLKTKLKAIENCGKYKIGVTLVPTVVKGINEQEMGKILRLAANLFPAVKSVHFQPVTYLGRYPEKNTADAERYTLDELMADLSEQTGISVGAFLPSRCDHALCEFHSTFLLNSSRQLTPLTDRSNYVRADRTAAAKNRAYVAEHWRRSEFMETEADVPRLNELPEDLPLVAAEREQMEFNDFIRRTKNQTLKVSAMAFQDAGNIDLERLFRCSLHIYEDGKLLPFCAKYLTPVKDNAQPSGGEQKDM